MTTVSGLNPVGLGVCKYKSRGFLQDGRDITGVLRNILWCTTSDTVTISEEIVLTYVVCISRVPKICIQDMFLSQ